MKAQLLQLFSLFLLLKCNLLMCDYKDPHMFEERKIMVHLFNWKWDDIATECERFLAPKGYGGVQVSPPTEHVIFSPSPFDSKVMRPWYERYQLVSYKLESRSGNETQFRDMVERCNQVGIRIYVDVILNHMTGSVGIGRGTAGSYFDSDKLQYDGVPYNASDFHTCQECGTQSCNIEDFGNIHQVRNCRLVGLVDLDQNREYVRQQITDFLNNLISIGVAGFRVDAAKHMNPIDLADIYAALDDLNSLWFPSRSRPFIYQEVTNLGSDPLPNQVFAKLGRLTEFNYGYKLGLVFRRRDALKYLENFGEDSGLLDSRDAFVFIDNHDNQRGDETDVILTYKNSRMYKMATAFMLAWPYGVPRVMSSYEFNDFWSGPPHDEKFNILSVNVNEDLTCDDGWICEHRWRQIYNMVGWVKTAADAPVKNWWSAHNDQIAFSRGNRTFIAINNEDFPLAATIQSGLPPGQYCDIISGNKKGSQCTGRIVVVLAGGNIQLNISNSWEDPMMAIHVNAVIP